MNIVENYLHSRDNVINRFIHIYNTVYTEMDSRAVFGYVVCIGHVTDIEVTEHSVVLTVEHKDWEGESGSEEVTIPYYLFTSGTDAEIIAYYTQLRKDISTEQTYENYCSVLSHIQTYPDFVKYVLSNIAEGKDYLSYNDRLSLVKQYLKEKNND